MTVVWDEIWETLEIEKTRDKRAIKRAYGRMVVKCHPEDDPKMHQLVRDAYEAALIYAEEGFFATRAVYDEGDIGSLNYSKDLTSIFAYELNQSEQEELAKEEQERVDSEKASTRYKGALKNQFKEGMLEAFLISGDFDEVRRNEWFIIEFMNLSYDHQWTNFLTQKQLSSIKAAFGLDGFVFDDSEVLQQLFDWLSEVEVYLKEHFIHEGTSIHETLVVGVYKRLRWYLLLLLLVAIPSLISYDIGGIELVEDASVILVLGLVGAQVVRILIGSLNGKTTITWHEIRFACLHLLFIGGLLLLMGFLLWVMTAFLLDTHAFARVIIFSVLLLLYIVWYFMRKSVKNAKHQFETKVTSWLIFAVDGGHIIGGLYFLVLAILLWAAFQVGTFNERQVESEFDHTWTFTLPWTEEWGLETIRRYPEQALELERRIDWTVQRWLRDRYDQAFRTDHRLMMINNRFEPLELLYYDVSNPEKEVRIRLYVEWSETWEKRQGQRFLHPDMYVQLEVPFEQSFVYAEMEFFMGDGIAQNTSFSQNFKFEQEIHRVLIPLLYKTLGVEVMNYQNQNLRERGIDDMVFLYYGVDDDQMWAVRIVPVWESDEAFIISCWFSYHWEEARQKCE